MMQKTEDFHEGAVAWNLPRLRALCEQKPDTTIALVRAAWPDIRLALDSGHTLKRICEALNRDGLSIGYKTLSAYVGRLRRQRTPLSIPSLRNLTPAVADPLAQAMEACARPRYDIMAAHCDGDPSKKKLI
jgi:hypothetical protein